MAELRTFEQTYPRYDFSELVRLAMRAGEAVRGVGRRLPRLRPASIDGQSEVDPDAVAGRECHSTAAQA